jgi:Zn ribbon nucleic-acid-binding protein
MKRFLQCPNCHARAKTGFFSGTFRIFECHKCHRLYCYLCHGSHEGKRCPHCHASDYTTVGTCYPAP